MATPASSLCCQGSEMERTTHQITTQCDHSTLTSGHVEVGSKRRNRQFYHPSLRGFCTIKFGWLRNQIRAHTHLGRTRCRDTFRSLTAVRPSSHPRNCRTVTDALCPESSSCKVLTSSSLSKTREEKTTFGDVYRAKQDGQLTGRCGCSHLTSY